MKKYVFLIVCFIGFLNTHLNANEDLLQLFHLAVEHKDIQLVKEVIEALLKLEDNNKNLLDALAKYNDQGRIDFALHKAIRDKNVIASVILTYHSKDLNTRQAGTETIWTTVAGTSKSGVSRIHKTPLELAIEADLIDIIPYLLMKGANPDIVSNVGFLYEGEENIDYMQKIDCEIKHVIGIDPRVNIIAFYGFTYKRTFIGELIAKGRLDVIEILQKMSYGNWNKICCTFEPSHKVARSFTPLQFALAIQRYEIAQFLIDHGARIE